MAKFIMTYHMGPTPPKPEDGAGQMAKWQEWMQAHGDALLEPQNPTGKTKTLSAEGVRDGSAHPVLGYTIMQAADMDAALVIAQSCPFLEVGTLEISEIKQMG